MNDGFKERLDGVRARIEAACRRSGRNPADVNIVAVSKTFAPDSVQEAADCGLTVFGESRIQEARQKIPLCPGHIEWHMVGHVQRNKVRDVVRLFRMIHSVDSLRLLDALNSVAEDEGTNMPVLLEINVSGERSKFGIPPAEVEVVLGKCSALLNLDVVGLMTIPPFTEEAEDARPFFHELRTMRDRLRGSTGFALKELSMGMSNDFEIAVEEGATWVRLGTILFGKRISAGPGAPLETQESA